MSNKMLSTLSNSSLNTLNKFTCRYEQLQFLVIDEISLVSIKMLNVTDNRLRSIQHNQNNFFVVFGIITTCDFY
jgi:hypothetical protein